MQNLKFSVQNFNQGFLIDDECLAGLVLVNSTPLYHAFVVNFLENKTIEERFFSQPLDAISFLNEYPRAWRYESASGCDGEACGEGNCKKEGCGSFSPVKRIISEKSF